MKSGRKRQVPASTRRGGTPAPATANRMSRPIAEEGKRVTLPRALSKLGFCSRTQAELLIADGRVRVDGQVVQDATHWVDLDKVRLSVDGAPVEAEAPLYLMLNKPRGLVTTRHDPQGRATVFDCLKDVAATHVSPVGRLDKASEGLLLFTNDTEFAQALLDPETHVPKTYHVQIDRLADADLVKTLAAGVLHEGERLSARSVTILRQGEKHAWLEVVLEEGRNRQIRRMLEALDVGCLRLVRVAIGPLRLGDLEKGAVRPLSGAERDTLRRLVDEARRREARGLSRP